MNQGYKAKIRCSLVLLRSDGLSLELADTAFATQASWPTAIGQRRSPRRGSCSRRRQPLRPRKTPRLPRSLSHSNGHALAVVDA